MSPTASIIILTYNNLDLTRQCVESIFAKTESPDFELIVVDNASTDGTPDYLRELAAAHSNVKLILNDVNTGFAAGNNQGAAAATGEYLVFLNNDTVVTRGWLAGLIRHLQDPSVGMVGPATNGSSNETRVLHTYTDLDGLDDFAESYCAAHRGQSFEIQTLAFMCVALRRQTFEEIGPLDERFGLGMFEDDDYAMRLRQRGYKLLCVDDVYIHHYGGSSFLKLPQRDYWQLFRENRAKFEEKWNIKWQPHLQRSELLPMQTRFFIEWVYDLQWNLLYHEQLVERLRFQVDDLAQERERYLAYTDDLIRQLADLNQQIAGYRHEIDEIHSSRGWKVVQGLWRLRLKLLPHNSLGERILFRLSGRGRQAAASDESGAPTSPPSATPPAPQSTQPAPLAVGNEVAILTTQFFDFRGETIFLGGAERYLLELSRLIRELGYRPVVYQGAYGHWERQFDGFPIIGLDSGGDIKRLNERFHSVISPETPVIYLAFNLAHPRCNPRSIGISHGVFWDHPAEPSSSEQREQIIKDIVAPMTNLPRLVSVDTNTINWARAMHHPLAEKFVYIPNFVDLERFKPANRGETDKLVILYPRRLCPRRGFWLVHAIVPEFLGRYPQLEFHFVGQADAVEEQAMTALAAQYPGRVVWKELPLEQMPLAYQQADITLIPSLDSEGTSLSCLEAMASGNAVIATNVGGLPDLVLSEYNGLLIEPTVEALRAALHRLCQDKGLRASLGQKAIEVAAQFNLARWRAAWKPILQTLVTADAVGTSVQTTLVPLQTAPAEVKSISALHPKASMGWYVWRTREIIRQEGFGPLLRALGRKLKAFLRSKVARSKPLPAGDGLASDLWDTFSAERELRKGRLGLPSTGRKRVAYFTNQLLDWFDQRPRYGGGERYCLNLTRLLSDLGFEVDLYQIAPREFVGEYHGYQVKAIPHGAFFCEFNIGAAEQFYELSRQYDYVIYNLPELSSARMRPDAITICHGIWFDHNNYADQMRFRTNRWFRHLYRAFKNPKKIVSVDTNSINVIRALWPELSPKMTFIPNFVDRQLFFPPASRNNRKLTVLFPRRSQINRGSRILADILKNVPHDVDFYWVGEGDDYDTQLILDLCKKDARLHYATASFEEMPEWYRKADIVVIPTIACEGTSLACIEALACGCATIATNVGGLTDIIQDGVNGRSVSPTPIEIAAALNELITDANKRAQYQQQGLASAEFFSLDKWRAKWIEVLKQEQWIEAEANDPNPMTPPSAASPHPRTVIVTRNAIHGGVESLIKLESEGIGAEVIVAGGANDPFHSCPFRFTYVETYEELRRQLRKYEAVLYHWPLDWAVQAIKDSGLPSIEDVHRADTAECDKSVPSLVVSHSQYLMDYIKTTYGRDAAYLPNAIDTQNFFPADEPPKQCVIGAITSYYDTKGVDLVLQAWAMIAARHPQVTVRFYGAGTDLPRYQEMAKSLGVNVEFYGPTNDPASTLREYSLFINASRIEGLPIAVLEALATGLPVIASDIEGHAVINRLAEEKGFPPALILFESENARDLAEKIAQFLAHPFRPNSREFVEAAFSASVHNATLQELLQRVVKEHPRTAEIHFECLDHSWNNGAVAASKQAEGFRKLAFTEPSSGRLLFTHDDYLAYDYVLPAGTDVVSCLIHTANKDVSNVFAQIDWLTEGGAILSQESFAGRIVGNTANCVYLRGGVPTGQRPTRARIIARPNPQKTLIVDHIEIYAWKRT